MKLPSKFVLLNITLWLLAGCGSSDDTLDQNKSSDPTPFNSDWFEIKTIDTNTFGLQEPRSSQQNVSYLILGSDRTIMFDTGSGENRPQNGLKIKPVVDKLTQLPTTLILSHFHFDHTQNIAEFDAIAFPDLPFLRQRVTSDNTFTFTPEELFQGEYPLQIQVNEWLPVNTDIDLGDRIIQLVNIPGHTDESVAIIDRTNKLAFLGDYLYNGSLFLFDNADLNTYKESVEYLISILNDDYKLFGAHGSPQIAYGKLEELNSFLTCIATSSCQATSTKLWGYDVLIYENEGMEIVVFQ